MRNEERISRTNTLGGYRLLFLSVTLLTVTLFTLSCDPTFNPFAPPSAESIVYGEAGYNEGGGEDPSEGFDFSRASTMSENTWYPDSFSSGESYGAYRIFQVNFNGDYGQYEVAWRDENNISSSVDVRISVYNRDTRESIMTSVSLGSNVTFNASGYPGIYIVVEMNNSPGSDAPNPLSFELRAGVYEADETNGSGVGFGATTPYIYSISRGNYLDRIIIDWSWDGDMPEQFRVYRRAVHEQTWTYVDATTNMTFSDYTQPYPTNFAYMIRAYSSALGESSPSTAQEGYMQTTLMSETNTYYAVDWDGMASHMWFTFSTSPGATNYLRWNDAYGTNTLYIMTSVYDEFGGTNAVNLQSYYAWPYTVSPTGTSRIYVKVKPKTDGATGTFEIMRE